AREQLVVGNLDLVAIMTRLVQEKLPAHVEYSDLYSAGVDGLLDAASKFDPRRNVRFRTYARFRIRGAILDELRRMDWATRSQRQAINEGREKAATHVTAESSFDDIVAEVPDNATEPPDRGAQRMEMTRMLAAAVRTLP